MNEGSGRPGPATRDTWLMAMAGLAGLVLIAGAASYLHALAVVQAADGHKLVAWFIPVLADLLILTAGANILDSARCGHGWPPWSIVSAITGVLVTLGMNVAAGDPAAVPVYLVNGWPPVAFLLGAESFMGLIRRGRGALSPSIPGAAPAAPGHPEPLTADDAMRVLLGTMSGRGLADYLGVSRSRVTAWAARVAPVAEEPPAGATQDPPSSPAGATGGQGGTSAVPPAARSAAPALATPGANGQAGHG